MIRCAILSTMLLAVVLNKATIDNEGQLFWNTIKRWDVKIRDSQDMKERFANLRRAKRSVDRSTSGVILKSLNRYTVNNKAEEAALLQDSLAQYNATYLDLLRMEEEVKRDTTPPQEDQREGESALNGMMQHHHYIEFGADVPLPTENHYWEELGFKPAMNQYGCGSCWAFAAIPVIESLQLTITGYRQDISEQAVVDCIWGGIEGIHGCTGGNPKDLFAWAKKTQFLVSAEAYPYTGRFDKPCDRAKYLDPRNNGMSKIWLQEWFPTTNTMDGFLGALLKSPVAFGTYISSHFSLYSGGDWEDSQCAIRRYPHAMLLVGYTETTLRVRNTLGPDWGENGYVNLLRFDGSGNQAGYLSTCKYFDHGYYITATPRRDMQYKFCNGNKLSTRAECKKSCEDEGWDLACIPTQFHLNEAQKLVNTRYPKIALDNKFNLVWIGLSNNMNKDSDEPYDWGEGCTPDRYIRKIVGNGKFGLLNKNSGVFTLKSGWDYKARGLCSQALNCWDTGKAIPHGFVKFNMQDRDSEIKRSDGTKATVRCRRGYVRTGPQKLVCKHGKWNDGQPLPACEKRKKVHLEGLDLEGLNSTQNEFK